MTHEYDSLPMTHRGSPDPASQLARAVSEEAAQSQGGTNHENAGKKARSKQEHSDDAPRADIDRTSLDEDFNSGMGHARGEGYFLDEF